MEPGGEPMVLGMASDAVLAALATVVRRPRKRANIGLAVATQQKPRVSTGPTQLPPAMAAPPVTTARVWPEPSTISPMELSFTNQYTVATTTTPRPSTTPQMQLPSILATTQETTARDRPGRSVISPMQLSTKQTAVVDFWFGGDSRGGREVLKYIQEAVRSIKIGVDSLTNKEVVRELAAAVGRRVNIMLVVDLKKSQASGLEGVKALLEAGVQVCHCTEDLQCRAAIFDGQILVQGSQSWTENSQESSCMDYSMVLTGPIVSDFECQFDSMWNEAIKTLKNGDRKANGGIVMDQNHDVGSSEELSGTEGRNMTNKRKRIFFPTTFELLKLLGV